MKKNTIEKKKYFFYKIREKCCLEPEKKKYTGPAPPIIRYARFKAHTK